MSGRPRRRNKRHRLDRNPRRGQYWRTPRPDDPDDDGTEQDLAAAETMAPLNHSDESEDEDQP